MDDLLELFEKDTGFNSFHLDGQTIILDDYLQVRPEKRDLLEKYIKEGKLRIGPFYILQDDFLISSEANTRNMLIGIDEAKKWGAPVNLGYFPDTFGNMGQAPQMMLGAGLKAVAFGRGVNPTGFNNEVLTDKKYASQFSEMWWEAPDGSKILAILFANWYSNGNEIPVDRQEAKAFWDKKLSDASKYASTDNLLMMNGCDHQPVQKNISQAIKVANELYPDIEFVHSNFEDYIAAVKESLPEDLSTVSGELTSQETDGWYTLANTSSARIYLKQMNTEIQRLLENIAEPLAAMAYDSKDKYPSDEFRYAWKTLMQNHPHDSICGCSVDEVHSEMVTRFKKAKEVGKFLAEAAAKELLTKIDTSKFSAKLKPFVVFNTAGYKKTGIAEIFLEYKRIPFAGEYIEKLYDRLEQEALPELAVIDVNGNTVEAEITDGGSSFGYDLPKDKFRLPFMAKYIRIRVIMKDMLPMSWKSFALVEQKADIHEQENIVKNAGALLENEFLRIKVAQDGSLNVTDKKNGNTYSKLMVFEDTGDIGNEYIFKQPEGDETITTVNTKAEITVKANSYMYGEIEITHRINIPVSADELLEKEQKSIVEFRNRKASRSEITAELILKTKLILERGSQQIKLETSFDNQMKDHRLRVLFNTEIIGSEHEAESIYEVIKRSNSVSDTWQNPTNAQHQQSFVNISDENHGVTVANYGLNEYEILKDRSTIAVTLLRCVGELGDWGYFPTPEAQCLGKHTAKFAISFHGDEQDKLRTFHEAVNFQIPFSVYQTDIHTGTYEADYQYASIEGEAFMLTAFKKKENSDEIITRGYNMTDKLQKFNININGRTAEKCNLLEEPVSEEISDEIRPAEIVSCCWRKF
ncbi:mannosylglycerate hydrolase [Clostridium oryzae]|uniref:Mannosylglycerate hydrolase n=2 Tax=Clostridium oryzae TaxID=1450648 RepID=A0A1V4ISH5_9CLOT|nr:mannosylglycerate hydrolase [Clostridium oryzae]